MVYLLELELQVVISYHVYSGNLCFVKEEEVRLTAEQFFYSLLHLLNNIYCPYALSEYENTAIQ